MTKISFKSDGFMLAGNIFPASQPKDMAFLIIQGWAGRQNIEAAQKLASRGYSAMTYDMRGNGESEGNLSDFSTSRADFVKDSCVAYDYLKNRSKAAKIGVIGSSFGAYTGVLLTQQRTVYCLCLRVPAIFADEGFDDPKLNIRDKSADEDWRLKPMTYRYNHALGALHNFNGKVLIIEAEKDELVPGQVPRNYAQAIAKKSNLTYYLMKGAPHRLINDRLQKEFETVLLKWAESLA